MLDGDKGFGREPQLKRSWGGRYRAPLVQQSRCVGWPSEMEYGEFKGVLAWEGRVEQDTSHILGAVLKGHVGVRGRWGRPGGV